MFILVVLLFPSTLALQAFGFNLGSARNSFVAPA